MFDPARPNFRGSPHAGWTVHLGMEREPGASHHHAIDQLHLREGWQAYGRLRMARIYYRRGYEVMATIRENVELVLKHLGIEGVQIVDELPDRVVG